MLPKIKSAGFNQSGATLLEVMVALAILATAYVALMETQSGSIRLSTYGKQISIASFLAQSKLEEIEEKLLREGFPNMDEEEEDDFEELGYPGFKWRLVIRKVELPLGEAFEHMLTSMFSDDESKDSDAPRKNPGGMPNRLNDIRNQMQNPLGPGRSAQSGLINPAMFEGQLEMLSGTLEEALRELNLTVTWTGAREDEQLVITTHLVNIPSAQTGAGTVPGANINLPDQSTTQPRRNPR